MRRASPLTRPAVGVAAFTSMFVSAPATLSRKGRGQESASPRRATGCRSNPTRARTHRALLTSAVGAAFHGSTVPIGSQ